MAACSRRSRGLLRLLLLYIIASVIVVVTFCFSIDSFNVLATLQQQQLRRIVALLGALEALR